MFYLLTAHLCMHFISIKIWVEQFQGLFFRETTVKPLLKTWSWLIRSLFLEKLRISRKKQINQRTDTRIILFQHDYRFLSLKKNDLLLKRKIWLTVSFGFHYSEPLKWDGIWIFQWKLQCIFAVCFYFLKTLVKQECKNMLILLKAVRCSGKIRIKNKNSWFIYLLSLSSPGLKSWVLFCKRCASINSYGGI